MAKTKLIFVSFILIVLTGCAEKAPDCADIKTSNLVKEIVSKSLKETLEKQGGELKILAASYGLKFDDNFGGIKFSLDNIRIVDINEKIGKFSCSASLVSTLGNGRSEVPISYTSELADNGEKQYVEISGIDHETKGRILSVMMSKKAAPTQLVETQAPSATTDSSQHQEKLSAPNSESAYANCEGGNKTVFSCMTDKGKQIKVCDAGKTIEYSFGKLHESSDIVVKVPRSEASTSQWAGIGRDESYSVDIPNGSTIYNVFSSIDRLMENHPVEAGVNVVIKNKVVATVKCSGNDIVNNLEGIDLKHTE